MKTAILGAGLSGLSTAYFLQDRCEGTFTIFERETEPCGLCRSVKKNGYVYDIGPHILFSKDKEMLELMLDVLESRNDLRRSNRILYKGRPVQYPFENDLSKLPAEDLRYCITAFEHNPYSEYRPTNMIQFFLKTFGEGITNCYLRPYNEKIWKFDPAFMNTSMVDRIPSPTSDDIRRSAAGETVDGYVHQLYFSYPAEGGIESVPRGFLKRLDEKRCELRVNSAVVRVEKKNNVFEIETADGRTEKFDGVISTMPIQDLAEAYVGIPEDIKKCVDDLHYNSIAVAFVRTPYDKFGDNFAYMVPDKDVIFHRISKMDFLGEKYHRNGEATFMVEVTYREHDHIDAMPEDELKARIASGMKAVGFADSETDVKFIDISRNKYAYVVYDLNHSKNMARIRSYFAGEGVYLNGRFGNFEYWNMDKIVRESLNVSEKYAAEKGSCGRVRR